MLRGCVECIATVGGAACTFRGSTFAIVDAKVVVEPPGYCGWSGVGHFHGGAAGRGEADDEGGDELGGQHDDKRL